MKNRSRLFAKALRDAVAFSLLSLCLLFIFDGQGCSTVTIKDIFSRLCAQINKETAHCAYSTIREVSLSLSLSLSGSSHLGGSFHRNSFLCAMENATSVLPLINTNMTVPH